MTTTIPDIELHAFRAQLQQLRAEQVSDLEAANVTMHELAGQQAIGDAALGEVVSNAKFMVDVTPGIIAEIDAALARMDDGTYGRCETCHELISLSRLMVRPYGRRCVACNN